MPKDEDESSELTPAQTPDAKKSSGAWKFKFNEPDAICGRSSCIERRDEHAGIDGGYRCMLCDCPRFVVGGMTGDEQRADTEREMAAVREEDEKKK